MRAETMTDRCKETRRHTVPFWFLLLRGQHVHTHVKQKKSIHLINAILLQLILTSYSGAYITADTGKMKKW